MKDLIPIVDMAGLGIVYSRRPILMFSLKFHVINSLFNHLLILVGKGGVEEVDKELLSRVSVELNEAFSTVGFVYLKNHGIPQESVCSAFHTANIYVKCNCSSTIYAWLQPFK